MFSRQMYSGVREGEEICVEGCGEGVCEGGGDTDNAVLGVTSDSVGRFLSGVSTADLIIGLLTYVHGLIGSKVRRLWYAVSVYRNASLLARLIPIAMPPAMTERISSGLTALPTSITVDAFVIL